MCFSGCQRLFRTGALALLLNACLTQAAGAEQIQHVAHALGWVRMAPVAAVDHRDVRADVLGDEVRGARCGMPHDEHVGGHRFKVAQGVGEGFTLAGRGGRDVQRDHVRRQALGGQLEGCLLYTSPSPRD